MRNERGWPAYVKNTASQAGRPMDRPVEGQSRPRFARVGHHRSFLGHWGCIRFWYYLRTVRDWQSRFLDNGIALRLCESKPFLTVSPSRLSPAVSVQCRSVGVCRAVLEQCRGSVGAVSATVSGILDSGPLCTVSSSVGVSECRSVGVSECRAVSE